MNRKEIKKGKAGWKGWFDRNKVVIILLALLFLFHAVNNYIVLKIDNTPPLVDATGHYDNSVKHYLDSKEGVVSFVKEYYNRYYSYPPLFTMSAAIMYPLFGIGPDVGVMINLVYFLILLLSVFFIGRKLGGDGVGLFAAFIVSVFPTIFGLSRVFMLDFAVTAMVALAICLLLYTDYFKNRLFSILFGISLGLAFLVKWTTPLFIGASLLLYLIYSFNFKEIVIKKNFAKYKRQVLNFLISLFLAFLLSLTWIIPNFKEFFAEFFSVMTDVVDFPMDLLFYSRVVQGQISSFFFVLFVILLIFILFSFINLKLNFRDSDKKYLLLLLLWLIIPLVYFSLLRRMEPRWGVPYLPVFAILIAFSIFKIGNVRLRKGLILLVVLLALFQFFLFNYGELVRQNNQHIYKYGLIAPNNDDWQVGAILRTINQTRDSHTNRVTIFLTDSFEFYVCPPEERLKYKEFRCEVKDLFVKIINYPELSKSDNLSFWIQSHFESADYILYVEPVPIYFSGVQLFISEGIYDLFEENKEKFDKIGEFHLPDNKVLTLYKRVIYEEGQKEE